MKILGHTCLIGNTGYANHARSFFTSLNNIHEVKIRNYTIGNSWSGLNNTPHDNEPYFTKEIGDMLILQTLHNQDGSKTDFKIYDYDGNFVPDVHIVLMDMNHSYFYENYDGYKIAYNVWESTRYPEDFFNRLFYFDEVWVPTEWQYNSLIDQGYPEHKIKIVPEGVDIEVFKPIPVLPEKEKFRFLLFGRWDYRKSITEIIRTFGETFIGNENVELICSVENPFATDGFKTTKERVDFHNLNYSNVKYIDFPSREEYVKYLQEGNVFVSCSRSEGWNLPLIESLSCGIPSIYSDWGGQLQFAKDKGIPVKISHLRSANISDKEMPGEYCEPDFKDLSDKLIEVYNNYDFYREKALKDSEIIHREFNWNKAVQITSKFLKKKLDSFAFVTCGNINYMNVIEKLVQSLLEFSNNKIIVYGVDCEVPFDYPNVIKRKLNPPNYSEHDKWYWKQYSCLESLNEEEYDNFVWIDGDTVANYNIDDIKNYFKDIENYPLSDIHIQEEFYGFYPENNEIKNQSFNQKLSELLNVKKFNPYMHVCMYIYNKNCGWWFDEIIKLYKSIDLKDYKKYLLWNDEGIDNVLRWKYGFTKHLPLSNFDTSSYDGDNGQTNDTLQHFYTFCLEKGPKNFNRIYGYQYVPEDKNKILYFHGNKNSDISNEMINYLKLVSNKSFYKSEHFFTNLYKLENLGDIKEYLGSTMEVANKFGWFRAIYHEIYNLRDYYLDRIKRINDGDIVVDLGANVGIFNRWAYSQGASKVISFEPDKRYFKLLTLNADPRTILFNAAVSDKIGETSIYESNHLGGSNIFGDLHESKSYKVRTYSLNHLFETGLIDRIDFLKVDIEGAEILAFNGISDENLSKVKCIAMEYHHGHLNYDENVRSKFVSRLNMLGFNSHILFLGTDNKLQMIYFWK